MCWTAVVGVRQVRAAAVAEANAAVFREVYEIYRPGLLHAIHAALRRVVALSTCFRSAVVV